MTIKRFTAEEIDEARDSLRDYFPIGSTVSTVLRHVSRSGMERAISVLAPNCYDVSHLVARATTFNLHHKHQGLKIGGAGMDMGFHVVYDLSHTLYQDGYALKHRWV